MLATYLLQVGSSGFIESVRGQFPAKKAPSSKNDSIALLYELFRLVLCVEFTALCRFNFNITLLS